MVMAVVDRTKKEPTYHVLKEENGLYSMNAYVSDDSHKNDTNTYNIIKSIVIQILHLNQQPHRIHDRLLQIFLTFLLPDGPHVQARHLDHKLTLDTISIRNGITKK